MPEMEIRVDKGNPACIGKVICAVGVVVAVGTNAFVKFSKSVSGGLRVKNDITIISGDLPVSGDNQVEEIVSEGEPDIESNNKEPEPDAETFVFDPEIHHIEHRGAGRWYIMDGEEKAVDRALTEEEKVIYNEQIVGDI